jgi:hypothetical protein
MRTARHRRFRFVVSVILPLSQLFVCAAHPQTATQVGSDAVDAASVSSQLSGTWVGPFDTLANGESNKIFLKLQQSGSELKGSFMTLGYGMSLYGSIKDGNMNGPLAARDLWLHKAVSFDKGGYLATIPQHGVLLLRIDQVK